MKTDLGITLKKLRVFEEVYITLTIKFFFCTTLKMDGSLENQLC